MRQGASVLKDLREVATVDPASAGWTVDEMLGLILGRIADASSDVLATRNLCHCYCVVGNTVRWPVCKFLTATLLWGFCHWINFAAPIAVSIVSRQDWILPSTRI